MGGWYGSQGITGKDWYKVMPYETKEWQEMFEDTDYVNCGADDCRGNTPANWDLRVPLR